FYSDFLACQSKINPFFLLECARQAETVLSHTEFAIAVDSKFLLDRWSITYYPTGFDDTGTLKADVYTKEPTT
ncbi:AfsA-related hotdog domain-containing protein, partial [Klebsiella pneumoniae]|nr:AfsA-related hotdog domain-containing protein [Klebsiella pneumoniae]